jgi:hypothetical protein
MFQLAKDHAMLVAYGPDGQPVVADETPIEQVQLWSREHMLHCPNCRGAVHMRGGPDKRTQLHLAHQKGECAWSTEGESVRHMRGKLLLAQWLREQFPQATVSLEERLPEPNRIADIFMAHPDGRRWAIEFQCAPLDIEEWRLRHNAYHKAGIVDTWIIGTNRREKQEAFIEAIITLAHKILFLDPQVDPPRIWLRWPVTRQQMQTWQERHPGLSTTSVTPGGWVGRTGYGMTASGSLKQVHLDTRARLIHPAHEEMEAHTQLLQAMSSTPAVTEAQITAYMSSYNNENVLRLALIPLMKAYLHDPELLLRYNYGRGQLDQPATATDTMRIARAHTWLKSLEQHGIAADSIRAMSKELPYVGPYAAFVNYIEMLLTLLH